MRLLLLAVFLSGVAFCFGAALIPYTSSVFKAARAQAGAVVAVMFVRYSIGQVILLAGTAIAVWAAIPSSPAAGRKLFAAVCLALLLHGGWELNRRSVAAQKAQIEALETTGKPVPESMRKRFGMLHGVNMLILLAVLLALLGGTGLALWHAPELKQLP